MNYLEKLGKLFAYHSCPTLSAASVGCRCRYLRCQNIGLIYNNGYCKNHRTDQCEWRNCPRDKEPERECCSEHIKCIFDDCNAERMHRADNEKCIRCLNSRATCMEPNCNKEFLYYVHGIPTSYYNYKLYCIDHYHKHMGSNIFLSPNCRCGTPCSQPIVRMGMCYDHIKCTSECCQYIGCINLPERYQANRITGYIRYDVLAEETYFYIKYCSEHKCIIPGCGNSHLCLEHIIYNKQGTVGYLSILPSDILKICLFYGRILPVLMLHNKNNIYDDNIYHISNCVLNNKSKTIYLNHEINKIVCNDNTNDVSSY